MMASPLFTIWIAEMAVLVIGGPASPEWVVLVGRGEDG
jgi:hypothetical protein